MTGYALELAGEFLELYEDQEVNFSEEAPLLSEKTLPGMISLPALFPNSPKNRRLLGNLSDLQVWDYQERHPVTLHLFGAPYCQGYIILNDVTRSAFEFQFSEFDAFEDFNDRKLADLDWPSYDLSINDSNNEAPLPQFFADLMVRNLLNAAESGPGVTKDYVAPTVYNPAAIGSNEYLLAERDQEDSMKTPFQNLYVDGYEMLVKEAEINSLWSGKAFSHAINAVSIFPFAVWIFRKIFASIGIDINRYDLSKDEWHNLILYTNRAVTLHNKLTVNFTIPPFTHEPTFNRMKTRPYESVLNVSEYVPDISITDFLTAFKNTFNLAYNKDRLSDKIDIVNKSNVLAELKTIDITHKAALFEKWSAAKPTASDNLKWEGVLLDEKKTFNHTYKGNVQNFGDLPSSAADGDAYFVIATGTLFRFNGGSQEYTPIHVNNLSYIIDHISNPKGTSLDLKTDPAEPSTKITLAVEHEDGGINFTGNNGTYEREFFVPTIQQPINTARTAFDRKPSENPTVSKIILLLYRGLIESPEEFTYPYASADNRQPYNILPTVNGYECTLDMYAPKGIYETFHRKWAEAFKKTRTVFFDLAPDPVIWKQLFTNRLQIGNQQYIGSRKTIRTTPTKVKSCQLEALQIIL